MLLKKINIKLRRFKYAIYWFQTRKNNTINELIANNKVIRIANYPIIENRGDLILVLKKLRWYLPSNKEININITLNLNNDCFDKIKNDEILTEVEYQFEFNNNISKIDYKKFDIFLLFKLSKLNLLKNTFFSWFKKSILLDPNYYSTIEGDNFRHLLFSLLTQEKKKEMLLSSLNNYEVLMQKNKGINRVNLFLTGPSIDNVLNFNFDKSINIICNSIVKNNKYLEHINPDVIVFADPVYHFSYNEYSQEFLKDVIKMIDRYDAFCIVPEKSLPLLYYAFPNIRKKIIGIPIYKGRKFNFITKENFYSSGGASILPILMLPLAAGFAKEIFIIGADGREKSETFFWKHSKNTQYNDLIKTVVEAHPSFFDDRIYEDFYDDYCDNLQIVIDEIEFADKKVYSLTKSYIPVLSSHYYDSN